MKIKYLLIMLLVIQYTNAQVGIGTTDPKASLDITASNINFPSNTDGILIPRMHKFPTTNPTADQNGMMIFITGNGVPKKGFYSWNEATTNWSPVAKWLEKEGTNTIYNDFSDHIGIGTYTTSAKLEVVGDGMDIISGAMVVRNTNAKRVLTLNESGDHSTGFSRSLEINNSVNLIGNVTKNSGIIVDMKGASILNSSVFANYSKYFSDTSYLGDIYGYYSLNYNKTANNAYGFYNVMQTAGAGERYGVYSDIQSAGVSDPSGTGNLYGVYSKIGLQTAGSRITYGIYSDSRLTTGYAGYFIGRMSLGTSSVLNNRYLMPETKGTANQIMQIDGSGQVSFVDPATIGDGTGTDSQTIDTFSFDSGTNILTLEVENDGVVAQTVNLSSLTTVSSNNGLNTDAGVVQLGGPLTEATTVTLGTNNLNFDINSGGRFKVTNQNVPVNGTQFIVDSNGTTFFGGNVQWHDGNASGTVLARLTNSNDDGFFRLYENGLETVSLETNTGYVFNELGYDRNFRVESNNKTNMFFVDGGQDRIGIGTGEPTNTLHVVGDAKITNLAGTNNRLVTSNATGVLNNITDGSNGQLLSTNGVGVYSWLNSSSVGTDNQDLSGSTLTGTSLQIDIQNGSSTTVDLSGLQDGTGTDNQDLSLTTNTLSLTNDATTVDLSGYLDNTDTQKVDLFSLVGTTLGISLENDGVGPSTVNLSSLQDADWYETGNTPPNSINDDIFTNGNVGIGEPNPITRLSVNGGLSINPTNYVFSTGNITVTVNNTSLITVENTTANGYNLFLTNGLTVGQFLYIVCTNATTHSFLINELSGNVDLQSATLNIDANDVLTLVWNGSKWAQVSFSAN